MNGLVESKKEEVARICGRYGVSRLDLFGSASGECFDPDRSDLDFVVSFKVTGETRLFDRYFGLREELVKLFGREVDLLMEGAIRNPYFAKSVNESRTPLYAA